VLDYRGMPYRVMSVHLSQGLPGRKGTREKEREGSKNWYVADRCSNSKECDDRAERSRTAMNLELNLSFLSRS
jgi:hypothetical protein